MERRVKCRSCNGDGYTRTRRNRWGIDQVINCPECLGKGVWWKNKKPQTPRNKRART